MHSKTLFKGWVKTKRTGVRAKEIELSVGRKAGIMLKWAGRCKKCRE
jgi:hypothetical protein